MRNYSDQMKKTKRKLEDLYNNDLIFSVSLNILFLLIAVFLFRPFFEENDDTHLAMISEGVYGSREAHLIYINIILGYLYKIMLCILPSIRWYSVIQYLFIFISFTGITYVILKRKHGRLLSTLFVSACFYELYISLQYTKTSAFVASAGYVLLFEYLKTTDMEKKERKLLVTGTILLAFSFMLRDTAFLMITPFWGLAALYDIYKKKKIKNYILTFIPAFIIIAMAYCANTVAYDSDPEWRSFLVFNKARTQATDYRYDLFDYSSHKDLLNSRNVSENDALLLLTYQFGDDRVMNIDFFEGVVDNGPARKVNTELIKALCKNIYDTFYIVSPVLILLITALFIYALKKIKFPFFVIICAFAGFCYFQYSGRWSHRLVFAVVLSVLTLLVYMLPDPGAEQENRVLGALNISFVLVLIMLMGALAGNRFAYNKYMRSDPDFRAELDYMNRNKDTLFAIDTFTFQDKCKYDVFKAMDQGSMDNIVACGTWFTNCPVTKELCGRYGYVNPFEALEKGSGNVILVDNIYPDQKALFLSEHSGRTYTAEYIDSHNGFKNYRMVL